MTTAATMEQKPPVQNALPAVWDQVIADMHERDNVGRERYGTPLQPFNGRKPLVDLYQELLDAVVYIKQHLVEDEIRQRNPLTARGEVDERALADMCIHRNVPPVHVTGPAERMLALFAWRHMPRHQQAIAEPYDVLARDIVDNLPHNSQRRMALDKLLESRDCALRTLVLK